MSLSIAMLGIGIIAVIAVVAIIVAIFMHH